MRDKYEESETPALEREQRTRQETVFTQRNGATETGWDAGLRPA
jgi:hypothetical protein